jgi:hypothetical protein
LNKILFIAFACFIVVGFSQDDELYDHKLNRNKWEDIRKDIRYEDGGTREWMNEQSSADTEQRSSKEDQENKTFEPSEGFEPVQETSRPSDYKPDFEGLGAVGYVILILFGAVIVGLIIYLFLNTERKGGKVGKPLDIDEMNPAEIPLTELERLLQEAINQGDYRGAIRIYFTFILRDIAEKGWIDWEKEKTNYHYIREMEVREESEEFEVSVRFYEWIWYGKREIDQKKFEQIKPTFTKLLAKLEVN